MQLLLSAPKFGNQPFPLKGYEKRELVGLVRTYQQVPQQVSRDHFQQVDTGLNLIAKTLIPLLQQRARSLETLATANTPKPLDVPALRQAYLKLRAAESEIKRVLRSNPKVEAALEVLKDNLNLS